MKEQLEKIRQEALGALESVKDAGELDALRGLCILCVILIHLIFDLIYFIGLDLHLPAWYVFIQQYGGVIFVVLSGCCATLGSRSFHRGCIVFACGMLISLVTFGMYRLGMASRDVIVWFGVLHLLGICMMLYPAYKKLPTQALAAMGVVLVVTGYLISGTVVKAKFLFPFGFVYEGFASSDYFPLLPWFFVFLAGAYTGKYAIEDKMPAFFYKTHCKPLALAGRYTLWIYVLHQPVAMVFFLLIFGRI